jgi:uncharacterized protein (DUF2147 family)
LRIAQQPYLLITAQQPYYLKLLQKLVEEPNDKNGKPKTDIHNKDEKLRSQPVLGMVIIKKFKKASSANEYEDGTVYDPLSGKTYCGTMSLNGKELKLRGFICGINFVGRTSIWTSAE